MGKYFQKLFKKYNQQKLSDVQQSVIDKWYDDQVQSTDDAPHELAAQEEIWQNIIHQISPKQDKIKTLVYWKWAAAVVILFGISAILFQITKNTPEALNLSTIKHIQQQAILMDTENNEERIITDLNQIHQIASDNQLETIQLTAPKGSSFNLTLPDGTIVYLNADSKISYPRKFTGTSRQIYLEGEAYFEVAHNKQKPFIVQIKDAHIKVLGTKFNVRSYDYAKDKSVSLLEGSVQLSNSKTQLLLKPGETAAMDINARNISIQATGDTNPIAWKDGYFKFTNTPISKIAGELERWYNVDMDLSLLKKDIQLNGRISRSMDLKTVLEHLESIDEIHFETKGESIQIKNN